MAAPNPTYEQMRDMFRAHTAAAVKVIVDIMSGAGGKAFVSGADISQFEQQRSNADAQRAYDEQTSVGRRKLSSFPKPTIARVRGYCLGGGLAIAMQTDLRVAAGRRQPVAAPIGVQAAGPHLGEDAMTVGHCPGPALKHEHGRALRPDSPTGVRAVRSAVAVIGQRMLLGELDEESGRAQHVDSPGQCQVAVAGLHGAHGDVKCRQRGSELSGVATNFIERHQAIINIESRVFKTLGHDRCG